MTCGQRRRAVRSVGRCPKRGKIAARPRRRHSGAMQINRIEKPPALPVRPLSGHKGNFGRVLVVGGSDEMIGAPVLAGTAALRMGAGLVQVGMPREVLAAGLSITPELIG